MTDQNSAMFAQFQAMKAATADVEGEAARTAALDAKADYSDDRVYYPERDKDKNASVIIRFLPPAPNDSAFAYKFYSHGFQGDVYGGSGWYVNTCHTTFGEKCPVCEFNNEQWKLGDEGQAKVKGQYSKDFKGSKRQMQYIANILVIKDDKNPELEGKVMLFKFGKKIMDKIDVAMKGNAMAEVPKVIPHDPFNGANFNLNIKQYEGNTNYDDSTFLKQSPMNLAGEVLTEERMFEIWKSQVRLESDYAKELKEDGLTTYVEQKEHLSKILGAEGEATQKAESLAGQTVEAASVGNTQEATPLQTAPAGQEFSFDDLDV